MDIIGNDMMSIETLFKKYACDKIDSGYAPFYEELFLPFKNVNVSILEVGIGTITKTPLPNMSYVPSSMKGWKDNHPHYFPGASLRAFRDYFVSGVIYGCDIQPDCMFSEDRITTLLFNSTSKEECDYNLQDLNFDIIIDDGAHEAENQIKTFENLFHRANKFYIIEDVVNYDKISHYLKSKGIEFTQYRGLLLISKMLKTYSSTVEQCVKSPEKKIKYCFATDAHYSRYAEQFIAHPVKRYKNLNLNIPWYVSTNVESRLSNLGDSFKIFDINSIQTQVSNKYEMLVEESLITYRTYPWNLRRHIIRKAAEAGNNIVIYTDCDIILKSHMTQDVLDKIISKLYEPNTVKSPVTIWDYSKEPDNILFSSIDEYVRDLNLLDKKSLAMTCDGPIQVYIGRTNQDIIDYCDVWDKMTEYSYNVSYGCKNWFIENLIYTTLLTDFKIKPFLIDETMHEMHHNIAMRY